MRREFYSHRAACYYYLNYFTIILIIYTIICIIPELEKYICESLHCRTKAGWNRSLQHFGHQSCTIKVSCPSTGPAAPAAAPSRQACLMYESHPSHMKGWFWVKPTAHGIHRLCNSSVFVLPHVIRKTELETNLAKNNENYIHNANNVNNNLVSVSQKMSSQCFYSRYTPSLGRYLSWSCWENNCRERKWPSGPEARIWTEAGWESFPAE